MSNINVVDFTDLTGISGLTKTEQTTTPTITVAGGLFGSVTLTVTNRSSYTNPNFEVTSVVGSTTTVSNTSVKKTLKTDSSTSIDSTLDGGMTVVDTDSTSGTRTVTVRAHEFGTDKIASEAATATYDVTYVSNGYIRIRGVDSSGNNSSNRLAITDLKFYQLPGQQSSTNSQAEQSYPQTALTSNSSDSRFTVSQGHVYSSTYAAWKAMDSNTTGTLAWLLSTSAANNWWQIAFDRNSSMPTIKSMHIRFHSQNDATHFKISGSNTGSFSGEETDYGTFEVTSEGTQINFG
jgi:hypothetical protein